MKRLVILPHLNDMSDKKRAKLQPKIMVNPDHVGAVLRRSTYTTLIVQGLYAHIELPYDEVMSRLGFMT